MRVFLTSSLLFLLMATASAALSPRPDHLRATAQQPSGQLTLEDIKTKRNSEIGQMLGRRLSLGESIALSLVRGKLKRADRRQARRDRRNARRAARGLPPLEGTVDTTISRLAIGAVALTVISILLSALGGSFAAGLSFVGLLASLVFGAIGRGKYRGLDSKAFTRSNVAFWFGAGLLTLGVIGISILAAHWSA